MVQGLGPQGVIDDVCNPPVLAELQLNPALASLACGLQHVKEVAGLVQSRWGVLTVPARHLDMWVWGDRCWQI